MFHGPEAGAPLFPDQIIEVIQAVVGEVIRLGRSDSDSGGGGDTVSAGDGRSGKPLAALRG